MSRNRGAGLPPPAQPENPNGVRCSEGAVCVVVSHSKVRHLIPKHRRVLGLLLTVETTGPTLDSSMEDSTKSNSLTSLSSF